MLTGIENMLYLQNYIFACYQTIFIIENLRDLEDLNMYSKYYIYLHTTDYGSLPCIF